MTYATNDIYVKIIFRMRLKDDPMNILKELLKIITLDKILQNEPLKKYTYTKLGGIADYLILPTTYEEVQKIKAFTTSENIPLTIIGHGANLIIKDGGIRGIVMNLNHLNNISLHHNTIKAQSGAKLIDVSKFALKNCLSGLEFACGIPGSVGGALFMNAGAYGGEISDVLIEAIVISPSNELLYLKKDQLTSGYRTSAVAQSGYIVLEAIFELIQEEHSVIKKQVDNLTFQRETKQPLEYPSCGSVFKRPPGYFAGKLIQDSNLQGTRIGGAEISKKHAGFMVNVDNASATDYLNLIEHAQNTVKEKFGVNLETEVRIIGEDI